MWIRVIDWVPIYDINPYDIDEGDPQVISGDTFVSCTVYCDRYGNETHVHEYKRPTIITREIERDNYVRQFKKG